MTILPPSDKAARKAAKRSARAAAAEAAKAAEAPGAPPIRPLGPAEAPEDSTPQRQRSGQTARRQRPGPATDPALPLPAGPFSLPDLIRFNLADVRGSADTLVEISPDGVEALRRKEARLTLKFAPSSVSPEIRIDSFRGHLTLGFKGRNAAFSMGPCRQISADILFYSDARASIGAQTSINECSAVLSDSDLTIGRDCMFSHGILLQTSDQHGIIDLATRRIINEKRGITLGDHVWLGKNAALCPGVTIGAGAIVGMGSVVTKDVAPWTLVAGNPARELKTGVTWSREMDHIDGRTFDWIGGKPDSK
jgi:acetyltransferase-like isoleucine patch superfamily enzyme